MSVGPTPDWNRVPVRWHLLYLDEEVPTGNLEISVIWDRAIDEDTTDPIGIIGSKPVIITLDPDRDAATPVDFSLPATDDTDISRTGFTWHIKENLDQGGGMEFDFYTPLASLPDGVNLVRANDGTPTDPGTVTVIYSRFLTGSGAPANTLGADGDYYMDDDTLTLYGPKTVGVWATGTQLERFLVWSGTAYPTRTDTGPVVFVGPAPTANPETLGLMLNGDTWIDNSDPGTVGVPPAAPIYGNGVPEGAVTAPVGTEYIDLSKTRGAFKWIKDTGTGNTGWIVVVGDTGWRDVSASVNIAITGQLFIRRINNTVLVRFLSATPVADIASSSNLYSTPLGFRALTNNTLTFPRTASQYTHFYTAGAVLGTGGTFNVTSASNNLGWNVANGPLSGVDDYPTLDPWPTVLPGV